MKLGMLSFLLGACLCLKAHANYGFPESEQLEKEHPEFFIPGRVTVVTNGVPLYVFNGSALLFPSPTPGDYADMRKIAEAHACGTLRKWLCQGENTRDAFDFEGMLQIGRKAGSDEMIYVFAVPVGGVKRVPCSAEVERHGGGQPCVVSNSDALTTNKIGLARLPEADADLEFERLFDALDKSPADGTILAELAILYERQGYSSGALEKSREALAILLKRPLLAKASERQVDLLIGISRILKEGGEFDLARNGFKNALLNCPSAKMSSIMRELSDL